jgi:hypothetical protein
MRGLDADDHGAIKIAPARDGRRSTLVDEISRLTKRIRHNRTKLFDNFSAPIEEWLFELRYLQPNYLD